MRILVAGRSGQAGTSLAERAGSAPDLEIIVAGRPELDIEESGTLARTVAAAKPDVVVNAAAYSAVDKAETEEDRAFAVNATGAGNLARAAAAIGAPIIHLSTDYVFDGRKAGPYVETDPPNPQGAYGRSKLGGEIAVAAANPRHVILRTAWLYSPFGANFVKTMLRLAETREEIRVVDDQHGNPTYVPDLAGAILAIARRLSSAPEAPQLHGLFNLAAPETVSWCGFAGEIMAASRAAGGRAARIVPIPTSQYPTPAKRPANSRLDCRKIKAVYGITLPQRAVSLDECVRRLTEGRAAGA
jgi:dTDP-4-dehydrorhamnose reductase